LMQIGAGTIIDGSRVPVFHPIELLDGLLAPDAGSGDIEE